MSFRGQQSALVKISLYSLANCVALPGRQALQGGVVEGSYLLVLDFVGHTGKASGGRHPQVPPVVPPLVEHGVVGGGEEVALQGHIVAKLGALLSDFDKALLHNILGRRPRLEIAASEAVNQGAVVAKKCIKRPLIVLLKMAQVV